MFFFSKNTRTNKNRAFHNIYTKHNLIDLTTMKAFKLALIVLIVAFPLNINNELKVSSADGVSNYSINQSIMYQVELNYTFIHTRITPQNYYFKVARLNNRQPNSSITQYTPPYQEAQLLYNSITGFDSLIMGKQDKFNNTYDLFNVTAMSTSETITLSQKYIVKLNEVAFGDIVDTDIGSYDTSDEMFNLYCNNTETYYEIDDPALIAASNSIVDPSDNPLEKARKINNWVISHIEYDEFNTLRDEEMGAKWAFDNNFGDCSEYSSLMVTLLRIQGIPARKVSGYFIDPKNNFNPAVGEVITFIADSSGSSNFSGHAWVEYYIPEIGWIACEPQNSNYYKKIDYRRLNVNIGAWFFIPGASPGNNSASEFPYIPSPVASDHNAYTFNTEVKIIVLETDLLLTKVIIIIVIVSIVGVVIIGVTLLIRSNRKKKKQYKKFSIY